MENQSLKQENKLLKEKLNSDSKGSELNSDSKGSNNYIDSDIEDIMTEDFESEIVIRNQKEQKEKEHIQINVPQLKTVLYNRLKTYHEKHIDDLISTYGLDFKESIDKETMEKILLEAIHI